MTVDESSASSDAELEKLRSSNWSGCIPVSLSLAPSSLFSPTIPPPIHVLISRNTFLHVGLRHSVMRLHKFAPPTFSFTRKVVEEPENLQDEQDEKNNEKGESSSANNNKTQNEEHKKEPEPHHVESSYPVCWFEDEVSELPLRWQIFAGILFDSHRSSGKITELPWKIRVHFTQYPSSHLLQLESEQVLTTIERNFKHSLKQALVIQHGNNKVALNMTKKSHQQLWNSITTAKYSVYKLIQQDIQKVQGAVNGIPVRLLLGSSNKPWIQKRCADNSLTLGSLMLQWAPEHFERTTDDDDGVIVSKSSVSWRVCGVVPPLSTRLLDLWKTFCHPDTFLYISVLLQ
jgi:hypothetical protein